MDLGRFCRICKESLYPKRSLRYRRQDFFESDPKLENRKFKRSNLKEEQLSMMTHEFEEVVNQISSVNLAGKIRAQAIPLMVLLFLLFPRLPDSLLKIEDKGLGETGFSDRLSPGSVSRLVRDQTTPPGAH